MLLPPIGYFAAIEFYKRGHVDVFAALYMGVFFTIFASISSYYTLEINKDYQIDVKPFTIISGEAIFHAKAEKIIFKPALVALLIF